MRSDCSHYFFHHSFQHKNFPDSIIFQVKEQKISPLISLLIITIIEIIIIDKRLITVWLDQSQPQFYRLNYHYSDKNNLVYNQI